MVMDAAPTNSYVTEGPGGDQLEREDLSDVIARIDPDETPVYSNMDKGSCDAILTEWGVQELAAVDVANKQPEGYEAAFDAVTPPVRFNNYCQILARTFVVSRTMNTGVDKAGRDREVAYQKILKGLEIRRDLDAILTLNAAKDGVDPRGLAGLPSWMTNGSAGTTGTLATGDGSNTYTPGTKRAISLALISAAMQDAYNDGGQPEIMYMTPGVKVQFSAIPMASSQVGNELQMTRARDAVFIGSVSMYLTDFGSLEIAVDRFIQDAGTDQHPIFGIDPNWVDCCNLPGANFTDDDYAKTGDNSKHGVTWEGTLRLEAPKAHFMVADIDPLAAPA